MAQNDYLCSKCYSPLKIDKHIILLAEKAKGTKGLILFEPELGDYTILKHSSFEIKTGESLKFFCPVCRESLEDETGNFAEIFLEENEGETFIVRFSGRVGEQATYKIQEGHIKERFGNDSDKYLK